MAALVRIKVAVAGDRSDEEWMLVELLDRIPAEYRDSASIKFTREREPFGGKLEVGYNRPPTAAGREPA